MFDLTNILLSLQNCHIYIVASLFIPYNLINYKKKHTHNSSSFYKKTNNIIMQNMILSTTV